METILRSLLLCYISLLYISHSDAQFLTHSTPIGIHPLDANYFNSEVIKCKDGSHSFSRDRLNDDFCDCVDGTDEPGTSACPAGKFYCKNVGSTPKFLFSSRVNDRICDCCDGSDEYEGRGICPNTCVMGGTIEYKSTHYGSADVRKNQKSLDTEDSVHHYSGLKLVIILQSGVTILVAVFFLICRCTKSKRKHSRSSKLP